MSLSPGSDSSQGWGTTRLHRVPSRSIVSSTRSPGLSQPPTASGVNSRIQPVPTVPEPSTSPGRRVACRPADHAGKLELVIESFTSPGRPDLGLMADDARRIGEVKHGNRIPLGCHLEPAMASAGRHVLLEGVKVTDAGHLGEWTSHA